MTERRIGEIVLVWLVAVAIASCARSDQSSPKEPGRSGKIRRPASASLPCSGSLRDQSTGASEGTRLTATEAQRLEHGLKKQPDDFGSRVKLLGYYFTRAKDSAAARKARQRHVLWIIDHCPTAWIAGSPFAYLFPRREGAAYKEAKHRWLRQTATHRSNTAVLGNASSFFTLADPKIAEDLLLKAQTLEPANPSWTERLSHLHSLVGPNPTPQVAREAAARSFAELEQSYSASSERKRYFLLPDLARAAFKAGELKKAELYARDLLDRAGRHRRSWIYGEAVHHGNLVLGRIALRSGNVKKAKVHLIAAGKTPGSPALNSFGPNMTLASELLEQGKKTIVLEYFDLCGGFWSDRDTLDDWKKTVKAGGIPAFYGQLLD